MDDKARGEIKEKINKYNINFKKGFNPVPEFYSDQIDDLLGYVPGDPYVTKATFIDEIGWPGYPLSAYSTKWHPDGDYVVVTGDYSASSPYPTFHLVIFKFPIVGLYIQPTGPPQGSGTYRSIDWSRGGGYLVAVGGINSVDGYSIRIFTFDAVAPSVEMLSGGGN